MPAKSWRLSQESRVPRLHSARLMRSRMGLPFTSVSSNSTVSGDGEWMAVSPGYFGVLKIPILRGRDFNSSDTAEAPAVVLINETMARRFWQARILWGNRFSLAKVWGRSFNDRPRRIIGIVSDTRDDDLSQAPRADHDHSRCARVGSDGRTRNSVWADVVVDSHTPRTATADLSCFRATPRGKRRQARGKRPNHG